MHPPSLSWDFLPSFLRRGQCGEADKKYPKRAFYNRLPCIKLAVFFPNNSLALPLRLPLHLIRFSILPAISGAQLSFSQIESVKPSIGLTYVVILLQTVAVVWYLRIPYTCKRPIQIVTYRVRFCRFLRCPTATARRSSECRFLLWQHAGWTR